MTLATAPFTHEIYEVLTIPLADLDMPAHGRPINQAVVDGIADSIRLVGQLQPIVVRRRSDGRRYRLLVGQHRVAALRKLGATYVRAQIVQLSRLMAELSVIDENLCRNELTALERGEQLARRKEIHEALFPETKAGSSEQMSAVRRADKVSTRQESFANDTAAKTGQSSRTVRRDVEIGTKIAPDVRDAIRNTPIADSKTDLLELSRQTEEVQRRVVELVMPQPPPPLPPAPRPAAKSPADSVGPRPKPVPKPVDVRQAIREVKQQQRREEVAAKPVPEPSTVDATIMVHDATTRSILADGTVDLIVTSPPYGIDIAYGVGDVPSDEWESFMRAWMLEAFRVARDTGRLCVNIPLDTNVGGWRPTYAQAVEAALSAGWKYRNTIVWEESNVSRSIARGSVDSHAAVNVLCGDEMIAVFYKGEWPRTDGDTADIAHDDWLAWTNGHWRFHGESRAYDGHPAAFPAELPRRLIQLYSGRGATVLDPFCGSGTTLAVAHKLGRKAIGFDKDPQWVASARRRVQEVQHA